jgi:hypothetical protein
MLSPDTLPEIETPWAILTTASPMSGKSTERRKRRDPMEIPLCI